MKRKASILTIACLPATVTSAQAGLFTERLPGVAGIMEGILIVAASVAAIAVIAWLVVRDVLKWIAKRRKATNLAQQAKTRELQTSTRRREAFVTLRGAKLLYRMALRLVGFGTAIERVKRAYDEGFRPFWKGSFMPLERLSSVQDLVARYRDAIQDEEKATEYAGALLNFFVMTVLRYGTWIVEQSWTDDDEKAVAEIVAFAPTSDFLPER